MIKTSEAIRTARALIGTAYSELDCINLIKKVIRTAPGGDKNYTTAGTNDLWDSDSKSGVTASSTVNSNEPGVYEVVFTYRSGGTESHTRQIVVVE